jgi:cobalt/nickel transport system permease protein
MTFDEEYLNLGRLDQLSYRESPVQNLDPRVKVLATALFVLTVISFPKYEIIELVPFFLFPVLLVTLGDIPAGFILKKVLVVSPFAVFVGLFNPLFDTRTAAVLFDIPVSGGWISFLSILMKYFLTVSAALILVATTSFPGVCQALRRLGAPALFISQLLFLYRYLFVLLEETLRIVRARDLRSFGKRGTELRVATRIIGTLFLRTVERAERIYRGMLSRGFRGNVPVLRRYGVRMVDLLFLVLVIVSLAAFRFFHLTELTGRFVQELVP